MSVACPVTKDIEAGRIKRAEVMLEDAAEYLSERTYFFKVAAYRSLFEKRVGGPRDGQYIDLDFGHLRALASLDRDLRYVLLPLTLDVEHTARTKLVRIATEREGEDGYALSRDYMAGLNHNERRRREGEINMMGNDLFCGDLVRKYGGGPAEMQFFGYGGEAAQLAQLEHRCASWID